MKALGQQFGQLAGQGLSITDANHGIRLKWHRLRRSLADPLFSLGVMKDGFRIGASMELDLRVRADGGFVVLHDESLGDETDGKGLICAKTRAELVGLSFRDHPRPLVFSEDLADLLEASHRDARLQFDMKDDLDRIGSRGVDHLAEHFRDKAASLIFSGDCLSLIATLANRLPEIRRGTDPTNRLLLTHKVAGLAGVERSLIAEVHGPSQPEMIYLAWPLLLQLQTEGLDLVALCHAEGKQVDAWTYTPQGVRSGLSNAELARFLALVALKPDQITTDEAVALEKAWLSRRVDG